MKILGIETSCDETAAAIVKDGGKILSNVVASSVELHKKTGGVIPEIAAREQVTSIIPVIETAIEDSKLKIQNFDAIAVTVGPGLIGSLLVGVETAKTLAYVLNKPLVAVNHLIGHIYANFVRENPKSPAKGEARQRRQIPNSKLDAEIEFPAIALVVSGGHTDLILMKKHGSIQWLSGTRDDAAGEAFDKIARLLGLPYPGGPSIERVALNGNPKAFNFPRPMINEQTLDFSFSGLKTAVLREIKKLEIKELSSKDIANLAASVQQAIIDVLVTKTLRAAQKFKVKSILLGGGVAANQELRKQMKFEIGNLKLEIGLFVPPAHQCTDNAAMIAAAALFNYKPIVWNKIKVNPSLHF